MCTSAALPSSWLNFPNQLPSYELWPSAAEDTERLEVLTDLSQELHFKNNYSINYFF